MKYQQRARRTNQHFFAMSVIIGLLMIAIVYAFYWWASGHPEPEKKQNGEKADSVTCFFLKSTCNEAKNA